MSKKSTKVLSGALATTTILGSVMGATTAMAANNVDELYVTAYNATQTAKKEKTQESINTARKAVRELNKALENDKDLQADLIGTLSEALDPLQHNLFVAFYDILYKEDKVTEKESLTQAEINKAREFINGFNGAEENAQYVPSWSTAVDKFQQTNVNAAYAAVEKAQASKLAEDIAAAKTLVADLLLSTNADVLETAQALEILVKDMEEASKLAVESISAITSKNVTVKFAAPITAEQAKETTLTFVKGEVEYVAKATLVAEAKEAVFTFETALTEDGEYTLKGTELKIALTEFADAEDAKIAKSVVDAKDLVELRAALANPVFVDVDNSKLAEYKAVIDTLKNAKSGLLTVKDIQDKVINEVNVTSLVKAAINTSSNTVDEVKLYDALSYAAKMGALKNVDLVKYKSAYEAAAKTVTDGQIASLAEIQKNIIDPAEKSIVQAAKTAVEAAEAAPQNAELIKTAKEATAKVSDTYVETVGEGEQAKDVLVKADLTKRIADVEDVKEVLDAVLTGDQAKILEALAKGKFERVNPEFKVAYSNASTGIVVADNTKTAIQAKVDSINLTKAQEAVVAANMSLDAKKVVAARELVNVYVLPATEGKIGTKDYCLDVLNVEDALIAVVGATTDATLKTALEKLDTLETALVEKYKESTNAEKFEGIAKDKTVENEFDIKTVNELLLTDYRKAIAAEEVVGNKNQRKDIQAIITKTTDAKVAAQAKVIFDLVNDPKSLDKEQPTKTALTTLVKELQNLSKIYKFEASEKEVVINEDLAKEYFTKLKAVEEGNKNAATIVTTVKTANDGVVAERLALVKATEGMDADKLLVALKDKYLAINNVIDANKDVYFKASNANFSGCSDVDAVQAKVNELNELVEVNKAATAEEMRTALIKVAVAQKNTEFTNLSSQAKLEVAELVLAERNKIETTKAFADTAAVVTAIGKGKVTEGVPAEGTGAIGAREVIIDKVNAATTNATMITALEQFEVFANIKDAVTKVNVAETFINNNKDEKGNRVAYTTITAIKEDLAKAMK